MGLLSINNFVCRRVIFFNGAATVGLDKKEGFSGKGMGNLKVKVGQHSHDMLYLRMKFIKNKEKLKERN